MGTEQGICVKRGISVKNKVVRLVARTFGFISVVKGTVAITDRSGRFNGILGPGLHYAPSCLGYKVTGKVSLDMQLFECGTSAVTKDRAFVILEGFLQFRITAKEGFDLAVAMKGLEELFWPVVCLKVVEMDYASVCKNKTVIGENLDEFLEEVAGMWGIEACRIVIVNVEQFDPIKDGYIDKMLESYDKYLDRDRTPGQPYQLVTMYERGLEQKWTPAIEAFKLGGKAKKKGKAKKIQPMEKGKAKKIQPTD